MLAPPPHPPSTHIENGHSDPNAHLPALRSHTESSAVLDADAAAAGVVVAEPGRAKDGGDVMADPAAKADAAEVNGGTGPHVAADGDADGGDPRTKAAPGQGNAIKVQTSHGVERHLASSSSPAS